jgi:hypothetical protein
MDANELQALSKIEGRLGRLEALQEANVRANAELTASVNRLVEKLDRSDDLARDADQRARSAHHRIDETNKRIDDMRAGQKWAIGLTLTAIGLFMTAIGLIIKIGG